LDVLGYARLVAIMSMCGYHQSPQKRLHQRTIEAGGPAPIVTRSAGALVQGLHAIGAKKVSILTPHMKPLTQLVIESEGVEVVDSISPEILTT
jgi:maleate isomerase